MPTHLDLHCKSLKLTEDLQKQLNEKHESESTNEEESDDEDETWKTIAPQDGNPTSKLVGNTTWNYCIHHQKWCIHTSEDCRLGKNQADNQTIVANSSTIDKSSLPTPSNQINPSYAAMLAQIAAQSE